MSRVSGQFGDVFIRCSSVRILCSRSASLPQSPDILCHCQEHPTEISAWLSVLLEKLNLESLVTPSTSCRTSDPNRCSNSSTSVSSTTSCKTQLSWHCCLPNLVINRQQQQDDRYKVLRIYGTDLDAARRQIQKPDKSAR